MASITYEDVLAVGKELGYEEADLAKVIERAGSLAAAYRRLTAKLHSNRRYVERQASKRFAEQDAQRADGRHVKRHDRLRVERAASRVSGELVDRLGATLAEAVLLPGLGSGSVVGGSGPGNKKESRIPPPGCNDVVDFYVRRLVALIGNFERDVDAEKLGSRLVAERPEERDLRIVRDYEGWEAHDVASFDRSVTSAQIVERARRKHGRLPGRGYKAREEAA